MECQALSSEDVREKPRPPRPRQQNESQEVATGYADLQTLHDKGFEHIDKAKMLDDQKKIQEAISNYRTGLEMISKVLAVDTENLQESEDQKISAKLLQQKMTKTKIQIEYRLQALVDSQSDNCDRDESVDDVSFDNSLEANVSEIFSIPEGVQIFYITPEGFVSAPSYPSSLNIFKFTDESPTEASNVQRPPAFLQVGSWYYPLVPGTSPALRATNGAYIFPDTTSQQQGSTVGLLIPNTATLAQRQQFEQMLSAFTNLQEQQPSTSAPSVDEVYQSSENDTGKNAEKDETILSSESEVPSNRISEVDEQINEKEDKEVTEPGDKEKQRKISASGKIAKSITAASDWISRRLDKGSEKAEQYIKKSSSKLREKIKPAEEAKQIDPNLQKGVKYARKGTHAAVKASSYVVSKLEAASMKIAKATMPHLNKQGEKLMPDSVKEKSEDNRSKIDGVIEVAGSGYKGYGAVNSSLETAAKSFVKTLANEMVAVVDHTYGNQAANLSEDAIHAVGNVAITAHNIENLKLEAFVEKVAEDSKEVLVKDAHKKWKNSKDKSAIHMNVATGEITTVYTQS